MKKFLTAIALTALTISTTFACWFTQDNFNNTYISAIGNFYSRYTPAKNLESAIYYNNISTSLPCPIWFHINERIAYVNDLPVKRKIVIAELWYKLLPNGIETSESVWHLAKKFENPKFEMKFGVDVKLFGENIISKKLQGLSNIVAGDKIMLVWRITDEDAVSSGEEIVEGEKDPVITVPDIAHGNIASEVNYTGGYTAPFVTVITYNGRITPGR